MLRRSPLRSSRRRNASRKPCSCARRFSRDAAMRDLQSRFLPPGLKREPQQRLSECEPRRASAFRTEFLARVIDEHMPHDLGGHGKEMRAIAPSAVYTRKKAEKRLLDKGGRLHGMVPTLV